MAYQDIGEERALALVRVRNHAGPFQGFSIQLERLIKFTTPQLISPLTDRTSEKNALSQQCDNGANELAAKHQVW